jgi:hypothetical protein
MAATARGPTPVVETLNVSSALLVEQADKMGNLLSTAKKIAGERGLLGRVRFGTHAILSIWFVDTTTKCESAAVNRKPDISGLLTY